MKNTLIILSILFLIISCKPEEANPLDTTNIFGTWQLVAISAGVYTKDGFQTETNSIEDGYTFDMKSDMVFASSRYESINAFKVCNKGSFSLDSLNIISFQYSCEELESRLINYFYAFENSKLTLTPEINCDEGCAFKFKKIADEEVKIK